MHPSNDNRPAEFDAEIQKHIGGLYRFAAKRYGVGIEDLVQDTIENALKRWRAFRPGGRMFPWLAHMLRHTKYKQEGLRRVVRFTGDELPEMISQPSQEYAVDASLALSRASPRVRTLLAMAAQEFTFEEIGAEFGVSKQRAKQMVDREQALLRADTRRALAA